MRDNLECHIIKRGQQKIIITLWKQSHKHHKMIYKRKNKHLNKSHVAICQKRKRRHEKFIHKRRHFHNQADKGGAIVIIDVDDYVKESNGQLDNTEL